MSELLKGGLVSPVSKLMEDTRFQDWLLQAGLMERSENWQEVQPVWKNGGTDEILTDTERVVVDKLLTNRGYIVPHTQIVPPESKYLGDYTSTIINRIRNKLENPMLIFSAHHGFGMGVGIESLRLGEQRGRLLYRLWQDLGTRVPWEDLALGIYGYVDLAEHYALHTLVWRLRRESLMGTRATILSYPQVPVGGYTLIEDDGRI